MTHLAQFAVAELAFIEIVVETEANGSDVRLVLHRARQYHQGDVFLEVRRRALEAGRHLYRPHLAGFTSFSGVEARL